MPNLRFDSAFRPLSQPPDPHETETSLRNPALRHTELPDQHWDRASSEALAQHETSNRESKKQPLLNPKEKKAAKMAKKHAGDHVPLIVRNP